MNVSKGWISGTVTDIRIIFQAAIKANASGIIVCHNHPSGNLNPRKSDTKLTHKLKEAGNLMDIQLLDHLFVNSDDDYYSLADNGTLYVTLSPENELSYYPSIYSIKELDGWIFLKHCLR